MTTLLAKNALVVATMDDERREIPDGAIFVRDNVIEQVGPSADLPQTADEVLDLSGHVVIPGLVNTHHHFYQTLTRAVPDAQNKELFDWLVTLYPIWARITPEGIRVSAQVAAAELALSGCTTASDHLYIFPNGARLDDDKRQIRTVPGGAKAFHQGGQQLAILRRVRQAVVILAMIPNNAAEAQLRQRFDQFLTGGSWFQATGFLPRRPFRLGGWIER